MGKSKATLAAEQADREQAIKYLLDDYALDAGVKLYTIVRHVTQDRMSRSISVFRIMDDKIFRLDHLVARVLGRKLNHRYGGVQCGGTGMDMAFELIYSLGRALWPDDGHVDQNPGYRLEYRPLD